MRIALLVLALAIASAVETVGSNTTSPTSTTQPSSSSTGEQQGKGGCGLRCRKLTFIGEASIPVKPDWALLSLSVDVSSRQLQASGGDSNISGGNNASGSPEAQAAMKVREEAMHRSQFILNYLKDLNKEEIKDLQMQEISFRPDVDEDEDKFLGYVATFGLSFKVKLDKMQEVLDHIVSESGANRVDNIVLVADDETEKTANIQAIELATQNAWEQAQAVSKVFGLQGNLQLLSVREGLIPSKRLIRRFARRFTRRLARRFDREDRDDDMGMMGDMDHEGFSGMIGNWEQQGEQIINAVLTFQFSFEDGTINFKEVPPFKSNFTLADSLGKFLSNETKPEGEAPKPNATETIQPNDTQPANNVLPNNTAEMKPTETGAVVVVPPQPQPVPPQPQPTNPP